MIPTLMTMSTSCVKMHSNAGIALGEVFKNFFLAPFLSTSHMTSGNYHPLNVERCRFGRFTP